MEVILAKTSGFCFGVDRAVKAVEDNLNKEEVYTYGPIIHNQQVVDELADRGLRILDDVEGEYSGTVIIRSHGISPQLQQQLEVHQVDLIDATCPFVKRIHKIVKKHYDLGQQVVIVGNKSHPEVLGINGYCDNKGVIISSIDEAKNLQLSKDKDICLVSQTTFDLFKFNKIVEILKNLGYNLNMFSTICKSTYDRQHEAIELAKTVDHMIVIGGKHSSNTMKLYHICKEQCESTYHIETVKDLSLQNFKASDRVGITAGASTPEKLIEEVINTLRRVF